MLDSGRCRAFAEENLLFPKLLYVFLNFAAYSTYTFMGKFLKDKWGVSDSQYGYVLGFCGALGFLGATAWSMLDDKTRRHKLVLITAAACCAAFCMPLRAHRLFRTAPQPLRLFLVYLLLGGYNFCISALYPLVGNYVLALLAHDPRFTKGLFSRQLLFGTLGQATITVLTGQLLAHYEPEAMFLVFAISCALFIVVVYYGVRAEYLSSSTTTLSSSSTRSQSQAQARSRPRHSAAIPPREELERPEQPGDSDKPEQPGDSDKPEQLEPVKPRDSFVRPFFHVVLSPDFALFLLVILIASSVRAVFGNFLARYFEAAMGMRSDRYPLWMQMRLVFEIILFFWGKEIFDAIGNPCALLIGQLSGILRAAAYAYIPTDDPWRHVLPPLIEVLRGVNHACITTAGARYVHDIAPPGATASALGIFSGVQSNLSLVLAGFVGGWVLKREETNPLAYQILFRYSAFVGIVGCLVFCLHHTWLVSRR